MADEQRREEQSRTIRALIEGGFSPAAAVEWVQTHDLRNMSAPDADEGPSPTEAT